MIEKKLQNTIISYLHDKGCYVIKHSPGGGTPAGCPDISFYKLNFYGFIEVKAREKSSFQPLQQRTLDKLDEWSWAKSVWPENWEYIKAELEKIL